MNHNHNISGNSLKSREITNFQVTQRNNFSFKQDIVPRDFFGWILLIFIISSMAPYFNRQLTLVGLLLGGTYALYLLKEKKWLQTEFIIFLFWLIWSFAGYTVSINEGAFFKNFIRVYAIDFSVCL